MRGSDAGLTDFLVRLERVREVGRAIGSVVVVAGDLLRLGERGGVVVGISHGRRIPVLRVT